MTALTSTSTLQPAKPRWWKLRLRTRTHYFWLIAILALIGGSIGEWRRYNRPPTVPPLLVNPHHWPESKPEMRTTGRLRVLFLGNSLTHYNGSLPLILQHLSDSAQIKPTPVFDLVYKYGATWAQLWDLTQAAGTIREGHWDYVVMQDHSLAGLKFRSEMDVYARRFSKEIYAVGARPMFFITWPHEDDLNDESLIANAYINVAKANNGIVVPVGIAWQKVLHDHPEIILFDSRDNPAKHPTPAGSYLAACVFYAVLYHQSPRGLTGRIAEGTNVYINLSDKDALYLQEVAWQTVQDTGSLASTRPSGVLDP